MQKLVPDPFPKMNIEHISGSVGLSFKQFIFIVCQAEGYQNTLKLGCIPLAFTSYEGLPTLFSA